MNTIPSKIIKTLVEFSFEEKADPLLSQETNRSLFFLGFSKADQNLAFVMEQGIFDSLGNLTDKVASFFSFILPEGHEIHLRIKNLINNPNHSFPISGLINQLTAYSQRNFTEKLFTNNQSITWPQEITDAQITGSELLRILFDYPDLLSQLAEKIFRGSISSEKLGHWVSELTTNPECKQIYAGKEVDLKIICLTASEEHLARLSLLARQIFLEKFPRPPPGSLGAFSKINRETTLVGFNWDNILTEYAITNNPNNLSSNTCSVLSILNEELVLRFPGFCAAKFFTDAVCKIYTPRDFKNPQSWIRLMYQSDCVPLNDHEERMINSFLKPLESCVSKKQTFIECMMINLNYKLTMLQEYIRDGTFPSLEDKTVTRYLYILIRVRINTKSNPQGHPPSSDSNALFVFRCCQSLSMYGKMSDEAVAQLMGWLIKDKLLIYSETHELLKLLIQAISNKEIPFSLISAMTTLFGWIYQPESFTQRQQPSLFFMHHPFTFRVPTDLFAAIEHLESYLKKGGRIDKLKQIHAFFISSQKKNSDSYQKICHVLKLKSDLICQKTDFLLNHSDPFICFLGMQLKLIFNPSINDLSLLEKLPQLLQLDFKHHLDELFDRFTQNHKIPEQIEINAYSLSGWIHLCIQSNPPEFTLFAYQLWRANKQYLDKSLDLVILESLSTVDPRLTIQLFLKLYPDAKFTVNFSLKIFFNIVHSFPIPTALNEEIYPFLEMLIIDPISDFKPDRKEILTPDPMLNFLNKMDSQENQRFLLLGLILKGYFGLSELPENLKITLHPILPFLIHRQSLGFSSLEVENILSFFKPKKENLFSHDVMNAWIEMLTWIFYPNLVTRENMDSLKALQTVNLYLKSEQCNLKVLHDIYNVFLTDEHTESHSDICNYLEVDELKLIQEIQTLLEHFDPLISDVGLQAGVNISKLKQMNLFLLQLPKLLETPPDHQKALKTLFKRIVDGYCLDGLKLNPNSLEDWITLLARTKEIFLIDLAYHIWKENREKCNKSMDLLLFQALTLAEPNLALHHFCDLHAHREPRLTTAEYVTCLKLIEKAYQNQPLKIGLKRLFPLLNDLLSQKNFQNSLKKVLSKALIFFINHMEKGDQTDQLLLKVISNKFVSPDDLKNEILEFIFSVPMDRLSRLGKIIQIAPPGKSTLMATILIGMMEEDLKTGWKKFSLSDLVQFDELLVKQTDVLYQVKEWNLLLNAYIDNTLTFLERPHLLQLFSLLFTQKTEHSEISLLRTLAMIMDKKFPAVLPSPIRNYLTSRKENPIDIFNRSAEWEIVGIYIRLYHHYALITNDLISKTWQACVNFCKSQDDTLTTLILFLQTQTQTSWRDFFKSEKNSLTNLDGIPTILNRLIKSKNGNVEWIIFLLHSYINDPRMDSRGLNLDCSSENFIQIIHSLLPHNPSKKIKSYLFFENHLPVELMDKLVEEQIQVELKAEKIDFSFCLDLLDHYLPHQIPLYLSIFNRLDHYKEISTLDRIRKQMEKFHLLSDEFISCWILLFETLKRLHDPLIWQLLDSLPEIFHEDKFRGHREIAEVTLIRGAVLQLQCLHNNQSTIKNQSAQLKRNSEEDKKQNQLLNKMNQQGSYPFELYVSVFSSFSKNFICSQHKGCIHFLFKMFHCLDSAPSVLAIGDNFKKNWSVLKSACLENFDSLIPDKDSIEALTDLLEKSIVVCRLITQTEVDTRLISQIISYQAEQLTHSLSLPNIKDRSSRFFSLYANFSYNLNFEYLASNEIIVSLMNIIVQYYSYYTIVLSIERTSNDKQHAYIKLEMFTLLTHAIENIFPPHVSQFHSSYLKKILTGLIPGDSVNKNLFGLKKLLILQLIKRMRENETKQKKEDFYKIKNLFEEGMEAMIKENYNMHSNLITRLEETYKLLELAKKIKIYERENWLFRNLILSQINEINLINMPPLNQNEISQEVFHKLIEYNTYISTTKAVWFFLNQINYNKLYEDELRIKLFKIIMQSVKKYHSLIIEGKSYLEHINYERSKIFLMHEHSHLFEKNGVFYSYVREIAKIEFDTAIFCIKHLFEEENVDYCLISHYIQLAMTFCCNCLEHGFFHDTSQNYVEMLTILFKLVKDVKNWHLEKKIDPKTIFSTPSPSLLINTFTSAALLTLPHEQENRILKKYSLVHNLLKELIDSSNTLSTEQKDQNYENIFGSLFSILAHPHFVVCENYQTLIPSTFEYLEKSNLSFGHQFYLKSIQLHYRTHYQIVINPMNEGECLQLFEEHIFLLLQVPYQSITYWPSLYHVLLSHILVYFAPNPLPIYQAACMNFLKLHLIYFKNLETEQLKIGRNLIFKLIHTLIENQLIDISKEEFKDFLFSAMKWMSENEIDCTPLQLIELMTQFLTLDKKSFIHNLSEFVLTFANWIKLEEYYESEIYLLKMFEYYPEEKDFLTKLWEIVSNSELQINKINLHI